VVAIPASRPVPDATVESWMITVALLGAPMSYIVVGVSVTVTERLPFTDALCAGFTSTPAEPTPAPSTTEPRSVA